MDAAESPVVSRALDGTWLLYFTDHRWNGSTRNCTGPPASWGEPVYCKSTLPNVNLDMKCLSEEMRETICDGVLNTQRWLR